MAAIRNCSGKLPRYPITSIVAEGARQPRSCRHAVQVVGGPPQKALQVAGISVEHLKQIRSDGWDLFRFEQGLGPALLFMGAAFSLPIWGWRVRISPGAPPWNTLPAPNAASFALGITVTTFRGMLKWVRCHRNSAIAPKGRQFARRPAQPRQTFRSRTPFPAPYRGRLLPL
jgi:hypothetical protein